MAEKIIARPERGDRCDRNPLRDLYPVEYQAWVQLRQRCYNPNNESYTNYGARGIRVEAIWDTFEGFMATMGPKPSPDLSVERPNNDGNYGAQCYWGTSDDQNNNNRHNHPITYNGKTQNLGQWARELSLDHTALLKRMKLGWTVGQTLGFEPPPYNPYAHNGTTGSAKLACGINRTTYQMRIASGWSEEAARQPIDGRKHKQNKHPKYIYVSHPALGEGEFTIQQAALIVGKKPNTVAVAITRRGKTPLQALGLEE